MAHLLLYFGGLIAIGAVSRRHHRLERAGRLASARIRAGRDVASLTRSRVDSLKSINSRLLQGTMAALLIARAVPMVLFAFRRVAGCWEGEQSYRDYHYWINWRWSHDEIGTLTAGACVLWRFRLPFAMLPIAGDLVHERGFRCLLAQGRRLVGRAGWHLR